MTHIRCSNIYCLKDEHSPVSLHRFHFFQQPRKFHSYCWLHIDFYTLVFSWTHLVGFLSNKQKRFVDHEKNWNQSIFLLQVMRAYSRKLLLYVFSLTLWQVKHFHQKPGAEKIYLYFPDFSNVLSFSNLQLQSCFGQLLLQKICMLLEVTLKLFKFLYFIYFLFQLFSCPLQNINGQQKYLFNKISSNKSVYLPCRIKDVHHVEILK